MVRTDHERPVKDSRMMYISRENDLEEYLERPLESGDEKVSGSISEVQATTTIRDDEDYTDYITINVVLHFVVQTDEGKEERHSLTLYTNEKGRAYIDDMFKLRARKAPLARKIIEEGKAVAARLHAQENDREVFQSGETLT